MFVKKVLNKKTKSYYFLLLSLFPHRCNVASQLPHFCYFHGKCSYVFQTLDPPIQHLIARTCHNLFMNSNHPHFLHILFVRRKFYSSFFLKSLCCRTNSCMYTSRITMTLTSSSRGSVAIHALFSPLLPFLHSYHTSHTSSH